eukprot:1206681-Amphidinium_carterae.1
MVASGLTLALLLVCAAGSFWWIMSVLFFASRYANPFGASFVDLLLMRDIPALVTLLLILAVITCAWPSQQEGRPHGQGKARASEAALIMKYEAGSSQEPPNLKVSHERHH